jgi:KUP system potassium uptake protein
MTASPAEPSSASHHKPASTLALAFGSLGVVFGDIGTSPLYALREGLHAAAADGESGRGDVIAIVSLLVWLLILLATLKYVVLILRADNRGEGGTLSLVALGQQALGQRTKILVTLGILGTALFFGDAIITPAISVLSAVEGLTLIAPATEPMVIPLTLGILFALFWSQRGGTGRMAAFFGPVMTLWFITLAALGLPHIFDDLGIFAALDPRHGLGFLIDNGVGALPVLGSVFLAITGAEAMYADMGHFGRKPIRLAWTSLVFPALALSYLGQGALVLSHPEAASDPFFLQAPGWGLPFLVGFATIASVIASQAVITGAFSVAHQAVQLGLLPRIEAFHTSETQRGQIYMPRINLMLLVCVSLLVVGFGSSANLATAYGIAVTGEMLITTLLAYIVFRHFWHWPIWVVILVVTPLLIAELLLFAANLTKFADGGYLPAMIATFLAIMMGIWVKGSAMVQARSRNLSVALTTLMGSLEGSTRLCRTPGTAMFLTAEPVMAPPALLHNLKHNGVLHQKNYIVTVAVSDLPHMDPEDMVTVEPLSDIFTRVRLTFGYMDEPNVPRALRQKVKFDIMNTSFFLNRRSFKVTDARGMRTWQKNIYVALTKFASNAAGYYHLPSNRVVELGQQVTL